MSTTTVDKSRAQSTDWLQKLHGRFRHCSNVLKNWRRTQNLVTHIDVIVWLLTSCESTHCTEKYPELAHPTALTLTSYGYLLSSHARFIARCVGVPAIKQCKSRLSILQCCQKTRMAYMKTCRSSTCQMLYIILYSNVQRIQIIRSSQGCKGLSLFNMPVLQTTNAVTMASHLKPLNFS